MSDYPILNLCARIDGHDVQHRLVKEHSRRVTDWEGVLSIAEKEGMTPLLKKHLTESGCEYPTPVRRSLEILNIRHRRDAEIRLKVLQDILDLFKKIQIPMVVIKGAALAYTLYPDPVFRPMRDIDLFFDKSEVDRAQGLLLRNGFSQSSLPIPKDHHHLPSLFRTVDGVEICVELHRDLYPNCQPYYPTVDFEKLYSTGISINIEGVEARTFNYEETIYYLYQHGLRAPLTYEPYKLINVSDIIGFIEKYGRELNWEEIKSKYPLLFQAIPLLHYVTPWNPDRLPAQFEIPKKGTHLKPEAFQGWPNKRLKEFRAEKRNVLHILRETFIPSKWWLGIYYGTNTFAERIWCILSEHSIHVLWWAKLYHSLNKTKP